MANNRLQRQTNQPRPKNTLWDTLWSHSQFPHSSALEYGIFLTSRRLMTSARTLHMKKTRTTIISIVAIRISRCCTRESCARSAFARLKGANSKDISQLKVFIQLSKCSKRHATQPKHPKHSTATHNPKEPSFNTFTFSRALPLNCHPDLQVDAQVEGGEAGERHDVHHHQVHPRDVDTEIRR